MNGDTNMVLILDMGHRQSAGFGRLREQVAGFLGSLPIGWRVRLVGYGVRSSSDGDYLSIQPYVSTAEDVVQQFREIGNIPFSSKAGNPDCVWRWFAKMEEESPSGLQVVWFASCPERLAVKRGDVKVLPMSVTMEEIASAVGLGARRPLVPARIPLKSVSGRSMTLAPRRPTSFGRPEKEFNDLVVCSIRAFKHAIDISKFVQPQRLGGYGWTYERVRETYLDVLWNNPQLFYVNKAASYAPCVNGYGRIVAGKLRIPDSTYAIKPDQYEKCKRELDEAADRALATVAGVDDPVEVAKRLHDHIVNTCEYDMAARTAGRGTPRARTAYDVLVRHSAVCEGYVMGYRYLLSLAGIVSEEVVSDKMHHCWNYVRLGENWYHIDVTFDNPVLEGAMAGTPKYMSHEFFLLSDAALLAKGKHHDWKRPNLPPATDTRFDRVKWV